MSRKLKVRSNNALQRAAHRVRAGDEKLATMSSSAAPSSRRRSAQPLYGIKMWDVFISYASEDRAFAASLAKLLRTRGLEVWFDDFALGVGDSIRQSIEKGLAESRFGIVLLSRAFFRKDWPQRELNGLLALEVSGRKVILPVWHEVSAADVRSYSPILADRLGVSTTQDIQNVVERLLATIHAAGEESKPPSDRNSWPTTPGDFVLRVIAGPDQGAVFPLDRERMIVGRGTTADIRLSETTASRSHFAVVWDAAQRSHVAEDWGHPERIVLNGGGVIPRATNVLTIGDELRIGDTVLRYEQA